MTTNSPLTHGTPFTVCDLLDRVLERGVVLEGDLVISVAGVDLVYLRLEALLASVAKAIEAGAIPGAIDVPAGGRRAERRSAERRSAERRSA